MTDMEKLREYVQTLLTELHAAQASPALRDRPAAARNVAVGEINALKAVLGFIDTLASRPAFGDLHGLVE